MGLRVGNITFGGISSGLPTEDIIQQLLTLERRPIDVLQQRRDDFTNRLEILQNLNTNTRTLRDRLRELDNLGLLGTTTSAEEEFSQFTASSSDETVLTASASGLAAPVSLNVRVSALAAAERQVSQTFSSLSDSVGTGTFSVQIGSGTTQDITITDGTLEGFVSAINDADVGVTASIIDDGSDTSPFRILIQSDSTGADNSLTLTTSGLSGGTEPTFSQTQAAADAEIILDPDGGSPITINSSTNTFSDLLTGLSLTVRDVSASGTSERITVAADTDRIVTAIQDVVSAFNDVISIIQEQFDVDPTTNRGGPLIGDSTLTTLKQRLTASIASQIGSGDITSATQIGLSLDNEGQLTLDADELADQLEADFSGVRSFFAGADGLADLLRSTADAFVDTVDGALTARINGTTDAIADIDEQITAAEDRLGTVESNLVRQFAALERSVSNIQLQGNFLAQFLLSSQ